MPPTPRRPPVPRPSRRRAPVASRGRVAVLLLAALPLWAACGGDGAAPDAPAPDSTAPAFTPPLAGDTSGVRRPAPALTAEDRAAARDRYLVPSPSEIFNALDALGAVDWREVAAVNPETAYDGKYLRALNLGVRAADGFIAIEAEDERRFGEVTAVLFELGDDLGLGPALQARRPQLERLARGGSWQALRGALDSLRTGMEQEILALDEPDLVPLISVGGWLEGLRVVTGHLQDDYDARASTVLFQPRLVAYYDEALAGLPADVRRLPVLRRLDADLDEIRRLVDVGTGTPIPVESVRRLHVLSTALVDQIEAGRST